MGLPSSDSRLPHDPTRQIVKSSYALKSSVAQETLAEEQSFYREEKPKLLGTAEGKFALIKGRRLVGVYDSPDRAYAEGVAALGNVPMLIVRITKDEARPQVPSLSLGVIGAGLSP